MLLTAILAFFGGAQASAAVPVGFDESTVASGLTQPTAIAFLPDGRLLVTEKGGALRLVRDDGNPTLANVAVCTDKSMGLLGIAVDPGFASNGYVYLYRTRPAGGEGPSCPTVAGRVNEVVRIRLVDDRVTDGPTPIFSGIRTDNGQHNGGTLRTGVDGKLYLSTGDTGLGDFKPGGAITPPGGSTNPFAQDLGELPGKVLRIGLDGSVPSDNPFVGVAGARPEVFAYGFRNPFRFGIDPVTGLLWLGDVGQNTWEELDVVRAGGNYGWPICEGSDPTGCSPPGHVAPAFEYQQGLPGSLGASITGGGFAPCAFGPFGGQYFFGDYASDRLYRAAPNEARDGLAEPPKAFGDAAAGPVDIVFGPAGALYYVAIKAGEIRRISTAAGACASASGPVSAGAGPARSTPGSTTDRKPPALRLRYRSRQRAGPLKLSIRLDEPATVSVSASLMLPTRRPYRYKPLQRRLPAEKTIHLRLEPTASALRALRRIRPRQRRAVRLRVHGVDAAANVTHLIARLFVVSPERRRA